MRCDAGQSGTKRAIETRAELTTANTPEVMKTRLQLQGELQRADSNAPRVYKNALDVFVKTWRNEGIKGLQRGLFPAVSRCAVLHPLCSLCTAGQSLLLGFMSDGRRADTVVRVPDPA